MLCVESVETTNQQITLSIIRSLDDIMSRLQLHIHSILLLHKTIAAAKKFFIILLIV